MLRAIVTIVLLLLNTAFWGTLVLLGGIVKFAVHMTAPRSRVRTRVILALSWLAERWVGVNNSIFDSMLPTRWDVGGPFDEIRHDGRYLVISNHVSWVDIFALFRVFHRRAAFIRFFLKYQLIWFPIVGQAVWALEFPFLRRRPEHRQKDFETARRAAQRYRHVPVAVATFLEGTRFSEEKRDDQESPYRHLLRPRTGAIAFVLATLGDLLDGVYDVTLAYPRGDVSLWEFVAGRVPVISVRARRLEVPQEFFAEEITGPGAARDRFKQWIDAIWREKDLLLESEIVRHRDVGG
jgi:1-acyl-sn-glycerol-3-phosphate acyltransferase